MILTPLNKESISELKVNKPDMKQDDANWKRLFEVIRMTRHNVNSFVWHIGLSRGENLYQIQGEENSVSLDIATRIHDKYPEYPIAW